MRIPSELEAALQPLCLSYLRRLNEMATRVRADVLLREVAGRSESGYLVPGDDGFPLRFDVADGETGSTFEVRSAHFDKPLVERVRVGALEVQLVPGCWEQLVVACHFDERPVQEDADALGSILRSFAELAWHGGFSPRGAADPWAGRLHGGQVIMAAGGVVAATYDLGSCPAQALDVLFNALDGFGRDRAPLARVVVGGLPLDPNTSV